MFGSEHKHPCKFDPHTPRPGANASPHDCPTRLDSPGHAETRPTSPGRATLQANPPRMAGLPPAVQSATAPPSSPPRPHDCPTRFASPGHAETRPTSPGRATLKARPPPPCFRHGKAFTARIPDNERRDGFDDFPPTPFRGWGEVVGGGCGRGTVSDDFRRFPVICRKSFFKG